MGDSFYESGDRGRRRENQSRLGRLMSTQRATNVGEQVDHNGLRDGHLGPITGTSVRTRAMANWNERFHRPARIARRN